MKYDIPVNMLEHEFWMHIPKYSTWFRQKDHDTRPYSKYLEELWVLMKEVIGPQSSHETLKGHYRETWATWEAVPQ